MISSYGERILEWIHRRFPYDSNWLTGNCYQFALLLSNTFEGEIVYDMLDGHFMFLAKDGNYYDWAGIKKIAEASLKYIVKWSDYDKIDPLHYEHVMRDCAY